MAAGLYWAFHSLAVLTLAAITYGLLLPVLLGVGVCKFAAVHVLRASQRCRRSNHVLHAALPLASNDATFLCDTPSQRFIVNAVLVFDRPSLTLERVQHIVHQRVICHPSLARFSSLMVPDTSSLTGYSWVQDPHFDIARHVVKVPSDEAPHSEADLQAWLSHTVSEPLPVDKPLWTLLVIEEYRDGGSALVFRCHHVVGDGIVMSGVLLQECGHSPLPCPFPPPITPSRHIPPHPSLPSPRPSSRS